MAMFCTGSPIRVVRDGANPSDLRLTSDRRRHVAKVYAMSAAEDDDAIAIARLFQASPALLKAEVMRRAYEALPTDRGGPNGPKGKARSQWIAAANEAYLQAMGDEA